MPAPPRRIVFPGPFMVRPTESHRRKRIAAALARLALGALLLLALCALLAS